MNKPDKFLIGIVAVVLLIVAVSVVLVLNQPEPNYLSEDAPENIVHNYIMAVLQEDDQRAFGYLDAGIPNGPESPEQLARDLHRYNYRWDQDATYAVDSVKVTNDYATVVIRAIGFYSDDLLFGRTQYSSDRSFELRLVDGEWKISRGELFFPYCWTSESGCY